MYGLTPVLGGVDLPRPNSITENPERFGSEVVLAAGDLRVYDGGQRQVFELSWNKATEDVLAAITASARPAVTSYRHTDGEMYVVLTSPVQRQPIAATDPVRFAVSLTLREQAPK